MKKFIKSEIYHNFVADYEELQKRYFNIIRSFEDLWNSREEWKRKFIQLKGGKDEDENIQ